ncbi:glycine cleavage system protein R [Tundrisphaera sp. TA3]|uniref:glycine cleavage system protein R n=1 Tax=Tundrisphaera sp. TA3 TaxID=3435775 RepID=UPI003EB9EAD2
MPSNFVLTLTGPDRIGIVEELTGLLLERGGNVETSRMARLGGEFAVLMLVSMEADRVSGLDDRLADLGTRGYKVAITPARHTYAEAHPGWVPYRIEVQGADHEGIIHEVARYLSGRGISIESMESESTPAPTSGSPLFSMTAQVVVPPGESQSGWEAGLESIGGRLNLDITVSAARD